MPNLFTRSVISMGDGGLVVSLPISWARYHGLKPGDKVEVISNGELTVRPLAREGAQSEEEMASREGGG